MNNSSNEYANQKLYQNQNNNASGTNKNLQNQFQNKNSQQKQLNSRTSDITKNKSIPIYNNKDLKFPELPCKNNAKLIKTNLLNLLEPSSLPNSKQQQELQQYYDKDTYCSEFFKTGQCPNGNKCHNKQFHFQCQLDYENCQYMNNGNCMFFHPSEEVKQYINLHENEMNEDYVSESSVNNNENENNDQSNNRNNDSITRIDYPTSQEGQLAKVKYRGTKVNTVRGCLTYKEYGICKLRNKCPFAKYHKICQEYTGMGDCSQKNCWYRHGKDKLGPCRDFQKFAYCKLKDECPSKFSHKMCNNIVKLGFCKYKNSCLFSHAMPIVKEIAMANLNGQRYVVDGDSGSDFSN